MDSKMKMDVLIQLAYDSFGDADFDGVTDNVDQCPHARETYNRFQDTDGCPDLIPADGFNL